MILAKFSVCSLHRIHTNFHHVTSWSIMADFHFLNAVHHQNKREEGYGLNFGEALVQMYVLSSYEI